MSHAAFPMHRSLFRSHVIVYLTLIAFVGTFLPLSAFAQQPTATIATLTGTVLVNGQATVQGSVLQAGDFIETQQGASAMLELSDGSQIELGENTQLDLTQLSQTTSGARVSRIKLAWGWIRARLSPGHQGAGSTFDVETPNALIGVKFSLPQFRTFLRMNEQNQVETWALADNVPLAFTNFDTGETGIVPAGSTAIISAIGTQIIAGLVEAGALAGKTGFGTKAALAAAGVAAVGGATALALSNDSSGSGDSSGDSGSFTGIWVYKDPPDQWMYDLTQKGNSISGEYTATLDYDEQKWGNISGTVRNGMAYLEFYNGMAQWPGEEAFTYDPEPTSCERRNENGAYLLCDGWKQFYKQ